MAIVTPGHNLAKGVERKSVAKPALQANDISTQPRYAELTQIIRAKANDKFGSVRLT